MRRDYNNMCRQRCEDCKHCCITDAIEGEGYCEEFDQDINIETDGEFCEDFDQQ